MSDQGFLSKRFEENRTHLRAVAYRMLGSSSEAEDSVQESWLRLSRADTSGVENLNRWLSTVVARVCLDMLRSRKSRREESLAELPEPAAGREDGSDPEHQALLAESVGMALLAVLETLAPAERVAFVLHDMFDLSFSEIAPIVDRTPVAARQLASRARRRVQGAARTPEAGRARKREIVDAFLTAPRGGDLRTLIALLDPNAVLRADREVVLMGGAAGEVRGAAAVAETFSGRARAARRALIDGAAGAVWYQGGHPRVVFTFTIDGERITEIALLADPEQLARLDLKLLN